MVVPELGLFSLHQASALPRAFKMSQYYLVLLGKGCVVVPLMNTLRASDVRREISIKRSSAARAFPPLPKHRPIKPDVAIPHARPDFLLFRREELSAIRFPFCQRSM